MAEVVLDANVIVGALDVGDSLHFKTMTLMDSVLGDGHEPVLLDVLVAEAMSALCRRACQRKSEPPDIDTIVRQIRHWADNGRLQTVTDKIPEYFDEALGMIAATAGVLNFNDALLVLMQRDEVIEDVASFDRGFDLVPDFRRIS